MIEGTAWPQSWPKTKEGDPRGGGPVYRPSDRVLRYLVGVMVSPRTTADRGALLRDLNEVSRSTTT